MQTTAKRARRERENKRRRKVDNHTIENLKNISFLFYFI